MNQQTDMKERSILFAMANYVWNRVVCSKSTLDTYFIDAAPLGQEAPLEEPYISFNKLFGVRSLTEYREKIGVHIYYGFSFSWTERDDGLYEIKFATRWEYPIQAIIKALELDHEIKWFAVEENCTYVSKFYWNNGVKEDVMPIDDEAYFEWREAHMDFEESLEYCDDSLWYYLQTVEECWKTWESTDGFERYRDKAAYEVYPPL